MPLIESLFSCILPQEPKKYMDFSTPDPLLYDGVIVVENTQFYVNTKTLARKYKFFEDKFHGFLGNDKLHFDDVKKEDLQVFLEACHGALFLNDERVIGIYKLSKKWQCEDLAHECWNYLNTEAVLPKLTILELGVELDCDLLKNKILSEIRTVQDLNALVPRGHSHLSPGVTSVLFEKSMEFHRPPEAEKITDAQRRLQESVERLLAFIEETDSDNDDNERNRRRRERRRRRHAANGGQNVDPQDDLILEQNWWQLQREHRIQQFIADLDREEEERQIRREREAYGVGVFVESDHEAEDDE